MSMSQGDSLHLAQEFLSNPTRSLCVPVEEFELDAYHVVEAYTALVEVVVAAATAIELSARSLFGDADRRSDRRHRVPLGDDEQEGTADGGGATHRPAPGKAEQRPRGDTITPFG